ncbi:MAG: DUF2867 domain-containing protein [Bacteroidales bacterium]|nr:DUF2867 domain-containing protein [Bacteroidales bacterium]
MKKVIKRTTIPVNSTITNGFGDIDYFDSYQVKKTSNKSAEEISKEIMQLPDWVNVLLFIRNRAVGLFGLKTEKNTPEPKTFFMLIENRDEEIVMGEDDKHLNFRASIMKNKSEGTISLTTVVHYNNAWGRIYFLPVKPFHIIIMKTLLKRYLKKYNKENERD